MLNSFHPSVLAVPQARLRLEDVCMLTGFQPTKQLELVRRGEFPAPLKLGTRCTRWIAGDVLAWLDAQNELAKAAQVSR